MKVLDMVQTQQYLLALMEPAVAQDKGALVLTHLTTHMTIYLTYLTKMY
jgi:hypothetical protein